MSNHHPRVSIGLPVYNGEGFLATSIESMLAQTFTDFELIISDNASTDATAEICECYAAKDRRIRYVRHNENRGAIWNFNHVFVLSRGTYFRWQAHDDCCAPAFLERCVEVLDADPTLVQCHTDKARIDAHGWIQGYMVQQGSGHAGRSDGDGESYAKKVDEGRQSRRPHERFRTVLLGPSFCLDCFGLLRADALRQTRLILPFYGSEKVFSGELSLLGRCQRIREVLFYVRQRVADARPKRSAEQQQQYAGAKVGRTLSTPRLRLLWGHMTAVMRTPLPMTERTRCLAAVLEYVLQLRKWRRILTEIRTGSPIDSGECEILVPLAGPQSVDQLLRGLPDRCSSPAAPATELEHTPVAESFAQH